MQKLNKNVYDHYTQYPEKILQFGEGNFLRGFIDWQIDQLNQHTDFNGSVAVVQPRGSEKIKRLNEQDGLYTLFFTRNERRRSGKRAYDYQLNQPGN